MNNSNFYQHIAGPWCAGVYNPFVVFDSKGEEVVTLHNHIEQSAPRAALIAAAPDLFSALVQIASYKTSDEMAELEEGDFFEFGGEMAHDDMINMARTAVLLATVPAPQPEMVAA